MCIAFIETMQRRLLQLTGVFEWEGGYRAMETGFAASTKQMHALSVRWTHHMERGCASFIETMQRRLLQLTGVFEWEGGKRAMETGFAASTKQTHALSV